MEGSHVINIRKNTGHIFLGYFGIFDNFRIFFFFIGFFRAQEVFRNLPGARGVVFPKYEPVASHGDPFQIRNYLDLSNLYVSDHICCRRVYHFLLFGGYFGGQDPAKKMRIEILRGGYGSLYIIISHRRGVNVLKLSLNVVKYDFKYVNVR